jgi:hypothetical protein
MSEMTLAGYTIKFPEDWHIKESPSEERERAILVKDDTPHLQVILFVSELIPPIDRTILDVPWMDMLCRDTSINDFIEETEAEQWMKNIEVSMDLPSIPLIHYDLVFNGHPGFDLLNSNDTTNYAAYRVGYWLKDTGKELLNIWADFEYAKSSGIITIIKALANDIRVISS